MADRIPIELGPVQETLVLPLWGRALESQKPAARLVDRTAVEIVSRIDYDFSRIAANISELSRMAWIARSLAFDEAIRRFLQTHPDASVIDLGCGLDTTFERVDNGTLRWYDLDLPDVIDLRRRFMSESPRRRFLAASILDDGWIREIAGRRNAFLVAAGVLYYFSEDQVRALFRRLAAGFDGCEIVFDAASRRGVKVANTKVIADGGMRSTSALKWALESGRTLESWDPRIHLVREHPLFRFYRKGLDLKRRIATRISDGLRIMSIVHLRIDGASAPGA